MTSDELKLVLMEKIVPYSCHFVCAKFRGQIPIETSI